MGIVVLYVLFLVAGVIACGCIAGSLARARGNSYGAYFALGFLFGVVGVLAAAFSTRRPSAGEPVGGTAQGNAPVVVHHHHHYYDANGDEIPGRPDAAARAAEGEVTPGGARGNAPVDDGLSEGQRIARAAFARPVQPSASGSRTSPAASAAGVAVTDSTAEGQRIARAAFSKPAAKTVGTKSGRLR